MTITFEDDNDVIVYALEKVIAYARRTQQIFVAHCVWWLASTIGLEQGLVNYIDSIQSRVRLKVVPEKTSNTEGTVSPVPSNSQEEKKQDQVLKECEDFLQESKKQREVAALKISGRTSTGQINPLKATKDSFRVYKNLEKERRTRKREAAPESRRTAFSFSTVHIATEGIDSSEISRRKAVGECLRCAWPSDRKGAHQVKNCRRAIKLDKGTANFPKAKRNQQKDLREVVGRSDSDSSTSESSSDDSL